MTETPLRFARFHEKAIVPRRNNPEDAGLDLFALEDVVVRPGEIVEVKTGVHIALEEGETALFWDKSGRAKHGLTILGGCIDGPYRGELIVVVTNANTFDVLDTLIELLQDDDPCYSWALENTMNKTSVKIPYGKAVTQMLIVNAKLNAVAELTQEEYLALPATSRGTNGFGSSDAKEIV